MRAEIVAKIEKWQEPPPAKTVKPLPAPDQESKKKRGGKRHRLMKERYGQTEMRKQANRINFNVPEEEIGLTGEGMGQVGQSGSGRVRVNAGSTKKLQKDAQKARVARPDLASSQLWPRRHLARPQTLTARSLAARSLTHAPLRRHILRLSVTIDRCCRRSTGTAAL